MNLPEYIPPGAGLPAILGLIKILRKRKRGSYTDMERWRAECLISRAIKRLRSGASRRRRFSGLRGTLRSIRAEIRAECRR